MRRTSSLMVFLAVTLAFAGCSSSSTSTPPITFQSIYVGDVANSSLSIFAPHANGNVAPLSSIAGAATLLNEPYYIFVDSSGNMWASNYSGAGPGSITKYTAGSTGNVAPATTISGAATLLVGPCGLFVDSAGKIYSANCNGDTVNVYSAGASGNTAPAQSIAGATTTLGFPEGLTLDGSGNIWVGDCAGGAASGVKEWPNGANGNIAPTTTITNAAMTCPQGVAFDATGRIYVAQCGPPADAVFVFAAGSMGASAPTLTISGANTKLSCPYGVAIDKFGDIWVGSHNDVLAWPPGTTGNVAPSVDIAGAATGLAQPDGIALH